MTDLHDNIGYKYTRIHAPFARDYSVAQGPNATSYYNAFQTYDFLLSIGMKVTDVVCVQSTSNNRPRMGVGVPACMRACMRACVPV